MQYKYVGFLRGIGVAVLLAVLSYLSDIKNLEFLGNPYISTILVAVATAIEHAMEEKNGTALFGAVNIKA